MYVQSILGPIAASIRHLQEPPLLLDESGPTDFILHDSADELDPDTNIKLL